MKAYTDYPLEQLGDITGEVAPVRECEVLSCDGDKYCKVLVEGLEFELKAGYIYKTFGRCGDVPPVNTSEMELSV